MQFQHFRPRIDKLTQEEQATFFGNYFLQRGRDLLQDPAPKKKAKAAARKKRQKGTKKGEFAVTQEQYDLLKKLNLV